MSKANGSLYPCLQWLVDLGRPSKTARDFFDFGDGPDLSMLSSFDLYSNLDTSLDGLDRDASCEGASTERQNSNFDGFVNRTLLSIQKNV